MRTSAVTLAILLCVLAGPVLPRARAAEPAPRPSTPAQEHLLAVRAAQANGLDALADLLRGVRTATGKTVGQMLERGGAGEIALRLFLRSASPVGEVRAYSDGVVEVDLEVPRDAIVRVLAQACGAKAGETLDLAPLDAYTADGYVRVSGQGRAPEDASAAVLAAVESARAGDLPEVFPLGWEGVTATGRIEAVRAARVRAYGAMSDLLRAVRVGPTHTVGDLVGGFAAGEATLEGFVRSLPVAGPARFMPDRIAEVEVPAPVRDLLRLLKDIRAMRPTDERWTDDLIDRLSIRLKTDHLTAVGHGMPPAAEVQSVEVRPDVAPSPMPDWVATVLEAQGASARPDDVPDEAEARLLAARSAKARARADLEKQADAVRLDDGRTVRERAAKDDVFRRDLKTLLSSAKVVRSAATEDGRGWEVTLALPLRRLYEFSRPR